MPVTIDGTSGVTTPSMTLGTSALSAPTGSAPSYTCRAWVNFNGTGTVAIRGSGNCSSISDNGTGDYTVNFTNAMPDASYATCALAYTSLTDTSTLRGIQQKGASTTSGIRVLTSNGINTSAFDGEYVNVTVFR